ncbi:hypothetical protein DL766_010460 [Monosporascus sp. MC13-8B]|uniref:Uncharacterized protein n=1 Tax=Monosporascus cannonballus TaxID=155416 RepID=A0ABY0GX62_9PEZI|nr:hypothetical protein DL762_008111 [Monosporascus cannonballus]RYP01814.1 hypothetical protein DL766_010460 [Monosporascus sp. MC13-8B]
MSQIKRGLVDRMGSHTTDPSLVWGIDMHICNEYCSWSKVGTVFDFSTFTAGATNYLLPWLALTAQLPFETGEHTVLPNVMSFCYALGSPMLITYSLMITILNQHWLRTKFRSLESSHNPGSATAKNARIFLQESQQLPLRLSQEDGNLASLVVLPENADWWRKLRESIQITRRGVTLSLVAQLIVAILSWMLTVMTAFRSALGNPTEALIMSSGSLWIWLVSVICGWIAVGTQRDYGTIARALHRDMAKIVGTARTPSRDADVFRLVDNRIRRDTFADGYVDSPSPRMVARPSQDDIRLVPIRSETDILRRLSQDADGVRMALERQKAFKVAEECKLMQPLTRTPGEHGPLSLERHADTIPNCLGCSVPSDEKQEGPTFNYARIFTWDLKFKQRNLKGDTLRLSRYCGLADTVNGQIVPQDLKEYLEWRELDSGFYQRIVTAIAVALFVQWGTTGAATVISYLTEVRGLGCRSGGYMLYGILGVLFFVLLFASSIFSHAAMLRHEAMQLDRHLKEKERRPSSFEYPQTLRPPSPTALRVLAVVTRMLGRVFVVANAAWLILSSMWELVGFYNNCWCDGTALSKGWRGWIIVFKDSSAMAADARQPWAGAVFLCVFVLAGSCCVFWLYCRGNRM